MVTRVVLFVALVLFSVAWQVSGQAVHQCVHAVNKMIKAGDGSTEDSCMGCDPALPDCASDCQRLVAQLYVQCDGVCLPEGYYFDPQRELAGCWKAAKPDVKIKVERCGCDGAPAAFSRPSILLLASIIGCIAYYLMT